MRTIRLIAASVLVAAFVTPTAAQSRRPVRPLRSRQNILAGLKALAAEDDRVSIHMLAAKPRRTYMNFAFSDDLRHWAYVVPYERDKPGQLVVDGVARGPKRLYGGELFFVGHTAVVAVSRDVGPFAVNGKLWPHTGENSTWLASPDNKRIAHVVGGRAGPLKLIVDGKVVVKAHKIGGPIFSPDSKGLVYTVATEKLGKSRWRQWLWLDGERHGPYQNLHQPLFSPGGKRMACEAEAVVDGKVRRVILLDGKVIAHGRAHVGIIGFDAKGRLFYTTADTYYVGNSYVIDTRNVVKKLPGRAWLSPDGKRIALVVPAGPKSRRLVVDGKAQTPYTAIQHVTFAPVGDSIAYVASNVINADMAVVDDKVVATSRSFEQPIFSPDGRRVAFIAQPQGPKERRKLELIIDGRRYPAADFMSEPKVRFSADGKHWMAIARHGKGPDGREYEVLWDGKSLGRFERVLMTRDGRCVFAGWKSRTSAAVYVGDKPGRTYASVTGLTVSEDGRHVAYTARDADGGCVVVLDDKTFAVPAMPTPLAFLDGGTLRAAFSTYDGYALVDFQARELASP